MLVGLGDLGGVLLELLAGADVCGSIVVASRNPERGAARCNLTRLAALAQGTDCDIRFIPLDLNHVEAVAETVHRERPDVILTTATMQTWWLPDLLPPEHAAAIKTTGFGVWLPVHLNLTLKLMKALCQAQFAGMVLTAPYPDVVNCVLDRLGLAPSCGIGNVAEVVPKVRLLAARRLQVPVDRIKVWLVAHHALQPYVFGGKNTADKPPHYLRVERDGQDVTGQVEAGELLFTPYPIPPGRVIHFLTASTAVRLMRALHQDHPTLVHVPGPHGLPGGYPALASRQGLQMASIPGLSLDEAITINERSHRFDGIERIEEDGTVVFGADSVAVLKETLGYDCARLDPGEVDARAVELISRFREFADRCGVSLPGGEGAG